MLPLLEHGTPAATERSGMSETSIRGLSRRVRWQREALFWLGGWAMLVLFLWVLRGILLPFVLGMAVAYLLDPLADRLQRWRFSRLAATLTILVIFVFLIALTFILVAPLIARQLTGFLERLPDYALRLQALIIDAENGLLGPYLGDLRADIEESLGTIVGEGAQWLGAIVASIWSGSTALLGALSILVVTPVVAFYLLLDWDNMVAQVDALMPRRHVEIIRGLMRDVDATLSNFVRGQVTVCVLLGGMYAVALTLAGLNFGALIGMIAGIIGFIPYVGTIVGFILAVGVALVQFLPDWIMVGVIVAIFVVGQFIEGNILHPKLIGSYVGLHPVWLMFALFAFGALFGFLGVLLAVPVAAAMGVLLRFAVARYRQSDFYADDAA